MTSIATDQKLIQYLNEAGATELATLRTLQAHLAITPAGSYKTGLERHIRQTQDHADRVQSRLGELGQGQSIVAAGAAAVQGLLSQVLALSKGPFDLVRGGSPEEKLLKNAKDEMATETLEIATYVALEQLAKSVGDDETAKLAADIRKDEEKMLDLLRKELPKLTNAVVGSEIGGNSTYDPTTTGAADVVKETRATARTTAKKATRRAKTTARQARRVPGVAQAEGEVKGALASEGDLPIKKYGDLTADQIVSKLSELSQIDLAKVDAFERKNQDRTTITERISSLRGDEPWPGYDEQTVPDIKTALQAADDDSTSKVREYERRHKNRPGVLDATERELAKA